MNRIDARRESIERVVEETIAVVRSGGTVIFPTDTVYGIGCDPWRPEAVARIYALKARPADKPLSLHLATVTEMLEYAPGNRTAALAARHFLPGPLTLIVSRLSFTDKRVTAGLPSLGLRVPDHVLASEILDGCGPLAATSANFSGRRAYAGAGPSRTLPEADLFVDAGPTPLRAESSVLDLSQRKPRLVREGVITLAMLEKYLGPIVWEGAT